MNNIILYKTKNKKIAEIFKTKNISYNLDESTDYKDVDLIITEQEHEIDILIKTFDYPNVGIIVLDNKYKIFSKNGFYSLPYKTEEEQVIAHNIIKVIYKVSKIKKNYLTSENDDLAYIENCLNLIEAKDKNTRNHCERVAETAQGIALHLNLDREIVSNIYVAGLLHDIGKIGISDEILLKPGRLTDEEYKLMKLHSNISADILLSGRFKEIGNIVKYHHEKYDGTGYPDGISGINIPIESRILSLADSYDAMTFSRLYKDAMKEIDSINEIKSCGGTQFDPYITNEFLELCGFEEHKQAHQKKIKLEFLGEHR